MRSGPPGPSGTASSSSQSPAPTSMQMPASPPGLLLVDERSLCTALDSIQIPCTSSDQLKVQVRGKIQHSRHFTEAVLEKILQAEAQWESHDDNTPFCVDITQCPTLRSFLIRGYYLTCASCKSQPKEMILLTMTDSPKQLGSIRPVNAVQAGSGGDTPDSGSATESDLCEPLFQKMPPSPLNNNPGFWEELLSGTPEHLQSRLFHILAVKHVDVFPKSSVDFGDCTLSDSEFRIQLTSQEGFSTKPYPLNNVYRRIVEDTMNEMKPAC